MRLWGCQAIVLFVQERIKMDQLLNQWHTAEWVQLKGEEKLTEARSSLLPREIWTKMVPVLGALPVTVIALRACLILVICCIILPIPDMFAKVWGSFGAWKRKISVWCEVSVGSNWDQKHSQGMPSVNFNFLSNFQKEPSSFFLLSTNNRFSCQVCSTFSFNQVFFTFFFRKCLSKEIMDFGVTISKITSYQMYFFSSNFFFSPVSCFKTFGVLKVVLFFLYFSYFCFFFLITVLLCFCLHFLILFFVRSKPLMVFISLVASIIF